MNPFTATCKEVAQLLRDARTCLATDTGARPSAAVAAGVLSGPLDEYEDFLEHNELELAWDALVAVADRLGAPSECWTKLAAAAGLMQLPAKQKQALAKFQGSGTKGNQG